MTHTSYMFAEEAAVPGWAVIVIMAVVFVVIGGLVYVVLNRFLLGSVESRRRDFQ
jgi:hypothetical protein